MPILVMFFMIQGIMRKVITRPTINDHRLCRWSPSDRRPHSCVPSLICNGLLSDEGGEKGQTDVPNDRCVGHSCLDIPLCGMSSVSRFICIFEVLRIVSSQKDKVTSTRGLYKGYLSGNEGEMTKRKGYDEGEISVLHPMEGCILPRPYISFAKYWREWKEWPL